MTRARAAELVRAGDVNNRGRATGRRAILDKLQAMLGPHGVLPGREHGHAIAGVTEALLSIGEGWWTEKYNELGLQRSSPSSGEPLHVALAIAAETGARPGQRWSVGRSLEEVASSAHLLSSPLLSSPLLLPSPLLRLLLDQIHHLF